MIRREAWYIEALEEDLRRLVKHYQPGDLDSIQDVLRGYERAGKTLPWELLKEISVEDFWGAHLDRKSLPLVQESRIAQWISKSGEVLKEELGGGRSDLAIINAIFYTQRMLSQPTRKFLPWRISPEGTLIKENILESASHPSTWPALPDFDEDPEGFYTSEDVRDLAERYLTEHIPITILTTVTYTAPGMSPRETMDIIHRLIPEGMARPTNS